MNKILRIFIIAGVIALNATVGFSAPVINTLSGTFSDNNSVTINGSSFGTKSPAAPMFFDNFDNGSSGSSLASPWSAYSGSGAKYSSTSPYGGSGLCAHNAVLGTSGEFYTSYRTFSGKNELYYTFQNRYTGDGSGGDVYKNGRMNTGSNRYSGDGMLAISDNYIFYRPGSSSVYPDGRHFQVANLDSSSWQRHEMYGKFSSPAGTSNGQIWVQVGPEKKTYSNIVYRSSGYSFQYTSILLGLMMANTESGDTHRMYVDDVYVDSTQARIELCTGSTWSSKGHCAIQIPTAWSSTQIGFTFNQGSFSAGSTAYLYVLDSTNSASPAKSLTIGSGGSSEDTTPDEFSFNDITGAQLNIVYESNTITVTGINASTSISTSGIEYSKNSGAYTSASGTVVLNDTIKVRKTSSSSYSTTVSGTLIIGGVSDTFSVTTESETPPPDTTPNQFTFTDVTGAELNTLYTSNLITVTGINASTGISATNLEYSKNSGAYTSTSGTVVLNDTIRVRKTSSASYSTTVSGTLIIGGVSDTFSVLTKADPGGGGGEDGKIPPPNPLTNMASFEGSSLQ